MSCMNFDDPEKLERLNEGLVKRFWGHRRRKTGIIGIDSMLIEIFGTRVRKLAGTT